jgi:POT family proton-dependent oligopeptide transporter
MSYATTPAESDRIPKGIPYIVANEAAERFSYYGMRAILVLFMTHYLRDASGALAPLGEADARRYYHLFSSGAYLFPLVGAIVSDIFWGKYRTIITLSMVYCLGHFALALGDTGLGSGIGFAPGHWLMLGLVLIAVGAGGIKPCVSAHVGDQFGHKNQHLMERVYSWFYFSINFGAAISQLLVPYLLEHSGPGVAFGLPGVLMALATLVFWIGRHRFIHVPPAGLAASKHLVNRENGATLLRLSGLYVFIAFFWSLYDQSSSAWVLQAEKMDTRVGFLTILPGQVQAVNPIMILVLIPLFSYVIYPALNRVFPLTALRKIAIGMFLIVPSFLVSAYIEAQLADGAGVSIGWQMLAFLILTSAEVMVSITCLEFSYTQAPKSLKSLVLALYLASVSAGNLFTSLVNWVIRTEDGKSRLSELNYYLLFAFVMALAAVGFALVARRFQDRQAGDV